LKALVVDDSRAIRLIVGRILVDLGFSVVEATDGKCALNCLNESGPFDLAMVDVNMPVMNGFELLTAIKNGDAPPPRHIVMVTTENDPEQVRTALESGASEYVMKPFTRDIILDKLTILGVGPEGNS